MMMMMMMEENLKRLNDILYQSVSLELSDICIEKEAADYCGYNFKLGTLSAKFRRANITPKKTGQFVTLWKRSKTGTTEPFSLEDSVDLYIIHIEQGHNSGYFVFPRDILADRKILSVNGQGGKRGFRVYPKWDLPENKQAKQTQSWQTSYFTDPHLLPILITSYISNTFQQTKPGKDQNSSHYKLTRQCT